MRRSLLLLPLLALTLPAAAQIENSKPAAPLAPLADNPARDIPYPGTMSVDVDATDTARAIFRVRQTIPVARAGRMTLRYPEWLPGNHAPRGPIAALAGLKISAGGRPIAWTRDPLDVYAFEIDVPAGVQAIDLALEYLSPTESNQGRVVMTPEMLNLQWEKMTLYPAGYYTRNIPVRASVTLPAGWTGVAALDGETVGGNRISYGVTSYETLVDSPMFAGRHFRSWDLGNGVDLNVVADSAEELEATPEQIAAHRRLVDQAIKVFGGKSFDRYEFLLAISDEMSGIGLEHHRSSENAVGLGYFTEWEKTAAVRGLLPHEFTHSWNGKFRRGANLWTPDYRTPMQNNLLWVYEGQTSFWDYVLATRSGLWSKALALGELANAAAYYSALPGRAWRPMVDTTHDPIIAARRPKPYSSYQLSEDYYTEGALIWLEADMLIREQTGGRRSMDDFAKAFFGVRPGDWGTVTYTFEDVVSTLNSVAPHDWNKFLRTRLDQLDATPLGGVERSGYRLVWRDEPNAFQKSREATSSITDFSYSLGVSVGKGGDIAGVVWDGPMFRQGVTGAATIMAVNGREYELDRLRDALTAAKSSRQPIRLLVKEGSRFREISIPYFEGIRYPHLEKAVSGTAPLDRLLAPRR